jgi:hypothetical protein
VVKEPTRYVEFVGDEEATMTDRLKGLIVTFDCDVREDDAQAVIAAIKQLRGVIDVTGSVADFGDHMNRERIRQELRQKLWDALKDETPVHHLGLGRG